MDDWKRDIRYGMRMFLRTPGLSFIVVLSLALGIGANAAIFSLVNAVLLHPLPFRDSERLMMVWEDASFAGFPQNTPAPANYADWKSQNQVFEDMAAVANQSFNLTGAGEPVRLPAYSVTQNLFPLLGVRPLHGRFFVPQEDVPGADQVVMISYGLWQTRFERNPGVIGKEIRLNNKTYTVVGVMPSSFQFLDPEAQVWVPMAFTPEDLQTRDSHYLEVVGRLKKGVTVQQAQVHMTTIMNRIAKEHPDSAGQIGISVVPLREQLVGDVGRQLILLLLAVAFVLLIACANISNLLLSMATSRKREMAVRAALGAGKWQLVRQMLIESLLLAAAGGIVGLALGFLSFSFLKNLIPTGLILSAKLSIDVWVLAYTAGISMLTGLLFGLAPAFQVATSRISEALKAGGSRARDAGGRKIRAIMVVAETALAVILLVGAALLIQTIYNLQNMDTGFRTENILRMETRLPRTTYDTPEKRSQFYDRVLERVEVMPGVQSAGYSTAVPLDWKGGTSGYEWEGRPLKPGEILDSNHRQVSPRLLQTLGIKLIQGRYFDGTETEESQPVAIINEAMAQTYSKSESAVGKRFRMSPDTPFFTVVGVVQNIRNMGLEVQPKAEMYFPFRQITIGWSFYAPKELLIRTTSDPMGIVRDVREIVRSVDPNLPVSNVMTIGEVRAREIAHRRLTMLILVAFSALALLLATIGIYGVLSYFVTQQVPEIGVRLALGARPRSILVLVLRRGMTLALAGIALGVAGAFAVTHILQSMLYGIEGKDPKTFAAVALLLVLAALAACLLPGRRAMSVDPLAALRYE